MEHSREIGEWASIEGRLRETLLEIFAHTRMNHMSSTMCMKLAISILISQSFLGLKRQTSAVRESLQSHLQIQTSHQFILIQADQLNQSIQTTIITAPHYRRMEVNKTLRIHNSNRTICATSMISTLNHLPYLRLSKTRSRHRLSRLRIRKTTTNFKSYRKRLNVKDLIRCRVTIRLLRVDRACMLHLRRI